MARLGSGPLLLRVVRCNFACQLRETASNGSVRHSLGRSSFESCEIAHRGFQSGVERTDLARNSRNLTLFLRSVELQFLPAVDFLAGSVRRLFRGEEIGR